MMTRSRLTRSRNLQSRKKIIFCAIAQKIENLGRSKRMINDDYERTRHRHKRRKKIFKFDNFQGGFLIFSILGSMAPRLPHDYDPGKSLSEIPPTVSNFVCV